MKLEVAIVAPSLCFAMVFEVLEVVWSLSSSDPS